MNMEQLKFGIVSTSSIAPRFIAALRESGCGEVVALSSRTLEKAQEKATQRALLQYFRPENHDVVRKALISIGRRDLIGRSDHCLVPPAPENQKNKPAKRQPMRKSKESHQWKPKTKRK
jgi:hypothetical protein